MAAIIAPSICRYTINGTYGGEEVANIVDMQIDTTGSNMARGDAIEAQAGILINEWSDSILPMLTPAYVATSVSWVDLNSLSGSTGERTTTDQESWPQAGGNNEAPMPGNVALRVNKVTTAVRGQRQGRMYLVGMSEAFTNGTAPNNLAPEQVGPVNTLLENFLGDIEQAGSPDQAYTSMMVVVHTRNGVFESYSGVSALQASQRLGSQSRRLR